MYCATIQEHVPKDINLNGYADDHALDKDFNPNIQNAETQTLNTLQNCLTEINNWMGENRLKMNGDKTEIVYFGSKHQLEKCQEDSITVLDSKIQRKPCIRYLGAHLDSELKLTEHIKVKTKKAMFSLLLIRNIRKYIDENTCKTLVSSLVMSHLDYCSTILLGTTGKNIKMYQKVQNIAAKIICKKGKYEHVTDLFIKLHWLPIKKRIEFRALCQVWKIINDQSPEYLKRLLKYQTISKNLRSQSKKLLHVPRVSNKTFAARSFSVMAPQLWNNLSNDIRQTQTLEDFKSKLKTLMFKDTYFNEKDFIYY